MGQALLLIAAAILAGCTYTKTTTREGTVTETVTPGLFIVAPAAGEGDMQTVSGIGLTVAASAAGFKAVAGIYSVQTVFADACGLALSTDRPDLIPDDLKQPC